MTRFATLALMILPMSGQAEGIWTTMTGTEINAALTDRTLVYAEASQTFYASGKTLYNQGGRESWGSWRVDNNQYCSEWPPQGLWACYHMDRSGEKLRFIGEGDDITVGTYTGE
ncbi:hypothetical protein ASD8599_01563 [Ascidiaceihabitans donghaensis]|uniref:Uncharacterized protein n=1 Tax=Ascidiaceihabitans donghaensis TaxID=1510460 RepID=A0A2R8BCK3_9RHOB|nr:hypothetical protein [Ascidiaceihabitans donghaensis]SPH20822.1 hypothetical protein ASD8599_01563 [Ascidiaceihabitans donghaensis]